MSLLIRQNPRNHPSCHFCDFPSKMAIFGLKLKVLKNPGIQPSNSQNSSKNLILLFDQIQTQSLRLEGDSFGSRIGGGVIYRNS